MRDPSITNEAIDKWLYRCILSIIAGGLKAEGMVGVVAINIDTIHGHIWTKYRVMYDAPQKTPAFQYFFRMDAWEQLAWARRKVQYMLDNAQIKNETKAGKVRLTPTTPLDELAKILDE
jgi:hypothetical protein